MIVIPVNEETVCGEIPNLKEMMEYGKILFSLTSMYPTRPM